MAKKAVKGITIDIGGNTTPLNDALKEVNAKSRNLQTELKQVDKLLKLDPTNTELLAQKQQILSESIQNTEDKLNKLKEAQKNAKEQMQNGNDITAEQYRQLQRDIIRTEETLNSLKKAAEDSNGALDKVAEVSGELSKKSQNLQSELEQVNELLKFDPKNTELLAQKQKILSEAIETTKTKLNTLKEAEDEVQQQFKRGEISEEQYRELQREIVKTEKELNSLEKAAEDSNGALDKVAEVSEKIGNKSDELGKKLLPVTAGVTAIGTASVVAASKFEDAFAKMLTIADTTEVSADDLKKSIKDLSDETGIDAAEIADNVYNAISAGQKTGDAVNFVNSATRLAKAGFTDSGSALDILTTAMNAYRLEASEVTRVSDLLIQTQNLGKTTVADLSAAMGKVIPTAKANNVQLDQLCTGYAILTANGIATAESTTYMNSMLNELGKGGTGVDKILREKTGSSFSQLSEQGKTLGDVLSILNEYAVENNQSFSDLWSSSEAGKAGLVLLGEGAEVFNSKLVEMNGATGATDSAFEKLNTNSNKAKIAVNQLKNVLSDLGQTMLTTLQPIIEKIVAKIKEFSKWFSTLNSKTKTTIVAIGGITAAIGPALIAFGKMANGVTAAVKAIKTAKAAYTAIKAAVSSFNLVQTAQAAISKTVAAGQALVNAVMNANPIGLVVAAIAGLVAAFVLLWNKCEGFRNFFTGMWEAVKAAFQSFLDWISPAIETIKGYFTDLCNRLSEIWAYIIQSVQPIKDAVSGAFKEAWELIKVVWDLVKPYFVSVWEKIKAVFSVAKEILGGFFEAAWTTIKTLWDAAKPYFSAVWDTIKTIFSAAKEILGGFFKAAWTAIKATWDTATGFFTAIWNTIKGIFSVVKSVLSGNWSDAWEAIKGIVGTWKKFFSDVWDSIKAVFASTKSWFADTFAAAWEAVKKVFSTWGLFFSGLWDTIKETFSTIGTNIADSIGKAVKAALNAVISMIEDKINSAVKLINGAIKLINKIPGVEVGKLSNITLPRLARGTVLTKATPVIAGEDGAEAIMPLEKHTAWIDVLARKITQSMYSVQSSQQKPPPAATTNLGGLNFTIEKFENHTDKDMRELIGEAMEVAEEYIKRRGGAFA